MTQEQNIDFAKGLLVNSIYKSARLEGIDVTYNQVENILNDVNILSLTPKEMMKILGLRDAWNYLFGTVNYEMNLGYLETLHFFIAIADVPYYELGKIRIENVLITGNIKDFPKKDPFILTPREALCVLASFEVFISAKENYDKDFQKIVDSIIKTDKYTSGQELLDDIF